MNRWTEQFKAPALERIRGYEAFLASCGIVPVSGIEQEFYVAVPDAESKRGVKRGSFHNQFVTYEFIDSPYVEEVRVDLSDKGLYEIILGKGNMYNHHREKPRPHVGHTPTVMVKETDSTKRLMESRIGEYTGIPQAIIDYDGSKVGRYHSALQCNMSLWESNTGEPLFRNNAPDSQ